MFIIRILRYLMGYVRFRASGVFIERFINLISFRGIVIWDGEKSETEYVGCVSRRNYKHLRPLAKRAGLTLRIVEKKGLFVWRKKYRRRIGLLAGAVSFILMLGLLGCFVWTVEVSGNEHISDEVILNCMDELGLRPGVWKNKLNPRDLERSALLEIKELSWIAVNLVGCHATIEVSESIPAPKMYLDHDMACNLVAKYPGQIQSMRIYDGQSECQPGDTVAKGDLLISGIMETESGKTRFMHAHGEVMAKVIVDKEILVSKYQTVRKPAGEESITNLRFLMWDLPAIRHPIDQPHKVTVTVEPVVVLGMSTPFSIRTETYSYYNEEETILSEKQAKELAMQQLLLWQHDELKDAEIRKRELTGKIDAQNYVLKAQYHCIMDIAQESPVEIVREEKDREER